MQESFQFHVLSALLLELQLVDFLMCLLVEVKLMVLSWQIMLSRCSFRSVSAVGSNEVGHKTAGSVCSSN